MRFFGIAGRRDAPLFGLFNPGILGDGLSPKLGRLLKIGLLPKGFFLPREGAASLLCLPSWDGSSLRVGLSLREDLSSEAFLPNGLSSRAGLPSLLGLSSRLGRKGRSIFELVGLSRRCGLPSRDRFPQKAFFQTIFCPLRIFQRGLAGYYYGYSDDPRHGQSGHAHHDCWMSACGPWEGRRLLRSGALPDLKSVITVPSRSKSSTLAPTTEIMAPSFMPFIGGAKGNGKTAKTRPPGAPNSGEHMLRVYQ